MTRFSGLALAALLSLAPLAACVARGAEPSQTIVLSDCAIEAVKRAKLATDRPGVLAAIQPKEGDAIRENEVVARLMEEVPRAALEVAKLVAESTVEIEYAERLNAVDAVEYEKNVKANEIHPNAISDIEVRRLKLAEERSRLQIDKAKQERKVNLLKAKQAEAELNTYRILAPFDGVVSSVIKQRGEAVKQGDAILEVVNIDVVRVVGRVGAEEIWNVKVGSPVTVQLNLTKDGRLPVEKRTFRGHIGFVDSVSLSGEARVWAEVPNPENILRPGLKATMTIFPREQASAAQAPATPSTNAATASSGRSAR